MSNVPSIPGAGTQASNDGGFDLGFLSGATVSESLPLITNRFGRYKVKSTSMTLRTLRDGINKGWFADCVVSQVVHVDEDVNGFGEGDGFTFMETSKSDYFKNNVAKIIHAFTGIKPSEEGFDAAAANCLTGGYEGAECEIEITPSPYKCKRTGEDKIGTNWRVINAADKQA